MSQGTGSKTRQNEQNQRRKTNNKHVGTSRKAFTEHVVGIIGRFMGQPVV